MVRQVDEEVVVGVLDEKDHVDRIEQEAQRAARRIEYRVKVVREYLSGTLSQT